MTTPEKRKWLQDALHVAFGDPSDDGQAPSGRAGNVVEVKHPIVIDVGREARENSAHMDQTATAVNERAARIVTTLHQDMHDRVGHWFRNEALDTIGKMPDGPGSVGPGLVSAFAAGITGTLAVAFPEVAFAMLALKTIEGTVTTTLASEQRADAKAKKDAVAEAMNTIANVAEAQIYVGRGKALDAIPALVDALESDPDSFQRLASGANEDVEFLATKRIANRWGELAQPGILDTLEAKLHTTLKEYIKSKAKGRKREELVRKANNRYSTVKPEDVGRLLDEWESDYDAENDTENSKMRPMPQIDMTRP